MPSPSESLSGRRALVTAGSRGIGRAVATELRTRGAQVFVTGTTDAVAQPAAELGAAGWAAADFTVPGAARGAAEAAIEALGGVDILVANTGGPRPAPFAELSDEDWAVAYQLILGSATELASACLTGMTQRDWGRMVFLASTAGVVKPLPRLHLSNVMRAGVAALAQTLALEAGPHGVTTHVIATGPVDTERHEQIVAGQARAAQITPAEASRREDARVPVRRIGRPQELGAFVAYLCTEQAGFISGATHVIDGGLTLT